MSVYSYSEAILSQQPVRYGARRGVPWTTRATPAGKLSPNYWGLYKEVKLERAKSALAGARQQQEQEAQLARRTFYTADDGRPVFGSPVAVRLASHTVSLEPPDSQEANTLGEAGIGLSRRPRLLDEMFAEERRVSPVWVSGGLTADTAKSRGRKEGKVSSHPKGHDGSAGRDEPVGVRKVMSHLFPLFSVVVGTITLFFFLYLLSDSLANFRGSELLSVQDYFFYSLRNFITFATPDVGPVSSLGRALSSVEGMIGVIVMFMFAVQAGRLTSGALRSA